MKIYNELLAEQYELEERIAIMHYDGGLPLEEARRKATEALRDAQGEMFEGEEPK